MNTDTKITKAEVDHELREIELAVRLLDLGRSGIKYSFKIEEDQDGAEIISLTSVSQGHDGRELRCEHVCKKWRTPLALASSEWPQSPQISSESRELTYEQAENFALQWVTATERLNLPITRWTVSFARDPDGYEIIRTSSVRFDLLTMELVCSEGTMRRCWASGGYSDPLTLPTQSSGEGSEIQRVGSVGGVWGSNL